MGWQRNCAPAGRFEDRASRNSYCTLGMLEGYYPVSICASSRSARVASSLPVGHAPTADGGRHRLGGTNQARPDDTRVEGDRLCAPGARCRQGDGRIPGGSDVREHSSGPRHIEPGRRESPGADRPEFSDTQGTNRRARTGDACPAWGRVVRCRRRASPPQANAVSVLADAPSSSPVPSARRAGQVQ